ncbi:hypothetical protein N657DRAFT_43026 [Parathielavia appendiculata]|uniref:Uncharacterized protein n=1 Tax=Parathielavia appendiculata TaxID=2587402 RepID=A0AAN6UAC1_9PEZI|nr:hypothetical protein N657DRAFT_43026 [Parathielavia appendiculata]
MSPESHSDPLCPFQPTCNHKAKALRDIDQAFLILLISAPMRRVYPRTTIHFTSSHPSSSSSKQTSGIPIKIPKPKTRTPRHACFSTLYTYIYIYIYIYIYTGETPHINQDPPKKKEEQSKNERRDKEEKETGNSRVLNSTSPKVAAGSSYSPSHPTLPPIQCRPERSIVQHPLFFIFFHLPPNQPTNLPRGNL